MEDADNVLREEQQLDRREIHLNDHKSNMHGDVAQQPASAREDLSMPPLKILPTGVRILTANPGRWGSVGAAQSDNSAQCEQKAQKIKEGFICPEDMTVHATQEQLLAHFNHLTRSKRPDARKIEAEAEVEAQAPIRLPYALLL